jgi:exonuclease VII small subunit
MSDLNKTTEDKTNNNEAVKGATVQEKLSKLSELVAWFQSPEFKLEDAFDKFKQSETLAEEIEKDLTKLKNDIQVVKKKFDAED